MKLKVDEIIFNKEVYPRFDSNNETINRYRQNIENLPKIVVNKERVLIDGYHRLSAMAGGGPTIEACKMMYRRYLCYDLEPKREEIQKHNFDDGFPKMPYGIKPNLIFIDPPYWSMNKEKYAKGSWSELSYDEFKERIKFLSPQCYSNLAENGYLAFLIQNQTEKDLDGKPYIDWGFISYGIFLKKFKPVRRIVCPQSPQTFLPQQVKKAEENKRMLGVVRDLMVFQKERKI